VVSGRGILGRAYVELKFSHRCDGRAWDIDARAGCVVGQRSRKRIAIGDAVNVQLAGVDLSARELDLVLTAESLKTARGRARPSPAKQKEPKRGRGAGKTDRKAVRKRDARQSRRAGRRR